MDKMEELVLHSFRKVAEDLANKWNAVLTYDEILSEGWMLYAMKPEVFLDKYEQAPELFNGYAYIALRNWLRTHSLRAETVYHRRNYLCDDGMMDALTSGSWKLDAIYQPTPEELRRDIRQIISKTAPESLNEAWNAITPQVRQRLKEFALEDRALTTAERKASYKFIMRVM